VCMDVCTYAGGESTTLKYFAQYRIHDTYSSMSPRINSDSIASDFVGKMCFNCSHT
jgi:hypothetical protein